MDTIKDVLLVLVQAVIITSVPIVIKYVTMLFNMLAERLGASIDNEYVNNIIDNVTEMINATVLYVSQTYVDSLKAEGKFSVEEQKIAFQKAYDRMMELVGDYQKNLIESVFGDFSLWLSTMIEAAVKINKD